MSASPWQTLTQSHKQKLEDSEGLVGCLEGRCGAKWPTGSVPPWSQPHMVPSPKSGHDLWLVSTKRDKSNGVHVIISVWLHKLVVPLLLESLHHCLWRTSYYEFYSYRKMNVTNNYMSGQLAFSLIETERRAYPSILIVTSCENLKQRIQLNCEIINVYYFQSCILLQRIRWLVWHTVWYNSTY